MTRTLVIQRRISLAIISLGFLGGAITHIVDIVRFGWLPYTFAPFWMNVFWTQLAVSDLIVILMVYKGRTRIAIGLAFIIMAFDVAVNLLAFYNSNIRAIGLALPFQAAFFGYIIGCGPVLWTTPAPRER